jgi:hypothetical protein
MEKSSFTRVNLSDVRVIMMIMCVPVVELLCQAVTGWISVREHLFSGACGHLCNVLSCQALNVTASKDLAPVAFTRY